MFFRDERNIPGIDVSFNLTICSQANGGGLEKKEEEDDKLPASMLPICLGVFVQVITHPGGNPRANLKSISHRCYLFEVAFVRELTKETIHLPLSCLQGGATF